MSELENLRRIYLAAREQLLDRIIKTGGVGTKTYYNTVLKCLTRLIAELEKATDNFISSEIPAEYKKSLDETYEYFSRNNLTMKPPSVFAQLHSDAIYTLAREMQYNVRSGLASVGRQITRYLDESRDEALRQAGLSAAAEKAATGSTIVDMKKNMVKKLTEEGFMTVQYGAGKNARQVPLDEYAILCARSTTREAGNIAREIQLTENGLDLMKMTEHFPTCPRCAALQGRVYSISGNDKRFPPLSTVYESGYHNVHPNCRHVMVPFVEEFNDVEAAIQRSNAPFDPSEHKAELDKYNAQQRKRRTERDTRSQYERYKMRLGEDAPKSLRAFKRLKTDGGEGWDFMQIDYRRRGKLAYHPDTALPHAAEATAADAKFSAYLFNPENEKGFAKGVAFTSRLGYNKDNWQELQNEIIKRAALYPAKFRSADKFGDSYEQEIILYGKKNKPANVLVGWKTKDEKTWLATCYLKGVEKDDGNNS